jgi:hypothetical protein
MLNMRHSLGYSQCIFSLPALLWEGGMCKWVNQPTGIMLILPVWDKAY